MTFESTAQQHFLEAHPEKVGGREKLKEWENSTDFSHLPERKHMAKKEHEFGSTTIHHHKDGSNTHHHHHESGDPTKDKEYATLDHSGMMDALEQNLGGGATPAAGGGAGEAMAAGAAGAGGPAQV